MTSIRPESPRDWATLITIGMIIVGGVTSFVVQREALANAQTVISDLRADLRAHEDRLRALETSRTLETQISNLANEVAALKVSVSGMREDLRDGRRR